MGDMISQKLQDWDSNPSPSDSGAPHEPFSCSLEPFTGAAGLDDPRMGPALSGFWRPDWCSSLCPGGEHQVCPFPPHPTPPPGPTACLCHPGWWQRTRASSLEGKLPECLAGVGTGGWQEGGREFPALLPSRRPDSSLHGWWQVIGPSWKMREGIAPYGALWGIK